MSGVMEIFQKYCLYDKDARLTLAGDLKKWTWFKIYVFTKKNIDLEKEVEILNDLLSKQRKQLQRIFYFFRALFFT